MSEDKLSKIFSSIRKNDLTKNDLRTLISIIKKEFTYIVNKNIEQDDLDDIINDVLVDLTTRLLTNENEIENPSAYLKTIISNRFKKNTIPKEVEYLIKYLRNILEDLENKGLIHSNNSRYYCIKQKDISTEEENGYERSNLDFNQLISILDGYDFSEILSETKWNENKIDRIKKILIDFFENIRCIEFTMLVEIFKVKLGLKFDIESLDESFSTDDGEIETFQIPDENELDQEDNLYLNDIVNDYETYLNKFLSKNPAENLIIIKSIYLYFYMGKTFKEIANQFNYSSPTTIQVKINNHSIIQPLNFLRINLNNNLDGISNPELFVKRFVFRAGVVLENLINQ